MVSKNPTRNRSSSLAVSPCEVPESPGAMPENLRTATETAPQAPPKRRGRPPKVVPPSPVSNLTEKQAKFVDGMAIGLKVKDAMVCADMKPNDGTGNALMKTPKIVDALRAEQRKNAYMLGLTRDKVLQGMMDAIDQATILSDPLTQIAGWREVAKICGFYAPEVKKVELSGANRAVVDRMRALSDEELLEIANGNVIDAEYTEVSRTKH